MGATEKLTVLLIDAALAGIDRLILQKAVRDGEQAGESQDEITARVFVIMKAHGVQASIDIGAIPG
jgi:hypothetical protein